MSLGTDGQGGLKLISGINILGTKSSTKRAGKVKRKKKNNTLIINFILFSYYKTAFRIILYFYVL